MFTKQMQHSNYFVNKKEHIMWKTPCDLKNIKQRTFRNKKQLV